MLLDSDKNRLRHMLEAASLAQGFVANHTRGSFADDLQLQFAVIRCIEIIGEAAARMSSTLRAKIINTRNRLIHAYFAVDIDVVWRTVDEELEELVCALQRIAPQD